jgi:hypothetical protein
LPHSFIGEEGWTETPLDLISDVSRMLGVPAHRIASPVITRKLAEPRLRLGNRRVFRRVDVRCVVQALGRFLGQQGGR